MPSTSSVMSSSGAALVPSRRLALCFLVKRDVLFLDAWAAWLSADARALVFVHASDGAPAPEGRAALNGFPREFVPTLPTAWGEFSLIKAAQSLFERACHSGAELCVLLSSDAVPVVPFEELYAELVGGGPLRSWIADAAPNVNHAEREALALHQRAAAPSWRAEWSEKWQWRVSSQWVVLTREAVAALSSHWHAFEAVFGGTVCPDEHAYVVFFKCIDYDDFVKASPVAVDWDGETSPCPLGEVHPPLGNSPRVYHSQEELIAAADQARAAHSSGGPRAFFIRKVCHHVHPPASFW